MHYLPLIAFVVIIVLFITYAGRARRKQQTAQLQASAAITVGTEVMTTSGLHGTVVARNPDETVSLAIAPGVEVKWEVAALRAADSLPNRPGRAVPPAPPELGVRLDKPDDVDGTR